MKVVWAMYGILWVGFLLLLVLELRRCSALTFSPWSKLFLGLAGAWVVLGLLSLVDLQIGDRLYFPVVGYDYSVRTALTAAITRTGLPPDNPFFFPGHPVLLRYHYFWLIPSSLAGQVGGSSLSARQAMIASTLWCGIGLMALVPLYLRFFDRKGAADLKRRALIGIGLLTVTGLDLLPVIAFRVLFGVTLASIEWWNEPVMAWVHAVLWVPHHVAGLIACLTGLLVLWNELEQSRFSNVLRASIVAAVAFASAVGSSIYVTFVFAVSLAVWTLIALLRNRRREFAILVGCGLLAAVLSVPYLLDLRGEGAGGAFLKFGVRTFGPLRVLLTVLDVPVDWRSVLAHALFLPINYVFEFGFFFVAAWWRWNLYRKRGLAFGRSEQFAVTMAATSVLICSFLRSGVITNNDLGWRGSLVAQFVLLLWGVDLLATEINANSGRGGRWKEFVPWLLVLGVGGTMYEVAMQRFYPLLSDSASRPQYAWLSPDLQLGRRTYALRETYEKLQRMTTDQAVLQHNPKVVLGDLYYGLYADRQMAAEGEGCGAAFGGNPDLCGEVFPPLARLFNSPERADSGKLDALCGDLSISHLVVKDTDPVWKDKTTWVWSREPVLANDFARVFQCGQPPKRGAKPGSPALR
jgi:hypothetical protein